MKNIYTLLLTFIFSVVLAGSSLAINDIIADFKWMGVSCQGVPVNFIDSSTSSGTILTWQWRFGDPASGAANLSNDQNPTHSFNAPGVYNVKLVVTDNFSNKDSIVRQVYIKNCLADFSWSYVCAGDSTEFNSWQVGPNPIVNWEWNFGDPGPNNVSFAPNPKHRFPAPGFYNVRLIVIDNTSARDTVFRKFHIDLCPPTASFSWNTACIGDTTTFIDYSYGTRSITTWQWMFDDGATSALQHPKHKYANPGLYNVKLIVTDVYGVTDTATYSVPVNACLPTASFNWNTACIGDTTVFNDYSYGTRSIINWQWMFDDGATSALQHPKHKYANPGLYNVKLIVKDTYGTTDTATYSVPVNECLPTASFNWNAACIGDTTIFTDYSYGTRSIINWQWMFDDGATSALQHPKHKYANPGLYNVKLIVKDTYGTTDTATYSVPVNECLPTASFNWNAACIGDTSIFTDYSYGTRSIINWQWMFDDGATSALQHPKHKYANPGLYNVKLIVKDTYGTTDTTTYSVPVNACLPTASFNGTTACIGDTTVFTDYSYGARSIINWQWMFDDGATSALQHPKHKYANPGLYNVKLIVKDTYGATDTATYSAPVNECLPTASFNWNTACIGDTTVFTDYSYGARSITAWQWMFDDGATSALQHPKHKYANPGSYNVKLIVTNAYGSKDSVISIINIHTCVPVGAFSWTVPCTNDSTQFSDISTSERTIISWDWDFNDGGATSSARDPKHLFTAVGIYDVRLIVTDVSGTRDTNFTKVSITKCPIVNFTWSMSCASDSILFTATPQFSDIIVSWNWNFGNGQTSVMQNPKQVYSNPGFYDVKLMVVNNNDEIDSIIQKVQVQDCPLADFNWVGTCIKDTISFSISPMSHYPIVSQKWEFDDPLSVKDTSSLPNPRYYFANTGDYYVKLIVTNTLLKTDTIIKKLHIDKCHLMSATWHSACKGDSTWFTGYSNNPLTPVTSWNWDFDNLASGAMNNSSLQNPTHIFTDTGNYHVRLIASTTNETDTIFINLFVDDCSIAKFYWNSTCIGNPTKFHPTINIQRPAVSWKWDFGDPASESNNHSASQFADHLYADTGSYTVTLIAMDARLVTDTVTKKIHITDCGGGKFANFYQKGSVCKNDTTFFDAYPMSTAIIYSWNWNFGDGSTATGQHVNHKFTIADTFHVQLVITTDLGIDTINHEVTIYNCSPVCTVNVGADISICSGRGDTLHAVTSPVNHTFSYSWAPANGLNTTSIANPLASPMVTTTYTVTVTDQHNCISHDTITILVNPVPVVNAGTDVAICQGQHTSFTASGASNYQWSTITGSILSTSPTVVVAPLVTTVYVVNGSAGTCSGKDSVTVTVDPLPTLTFTTVNTTCGNTNGSTIVHASTGRTPYTYSWLPGGGTDSLFQNLSASTYIVNVQDALGCSNSGSVNIGNSDGPSIDSTKSMMASCSSSCDGVAEVFASGGILPHTYFWNTIPAKTTNIGNNLCTGSYIVTVADATGCSVTVSVGIATTGSNPTLSGNVTINAQPVTKGMVELYKTNASSAAMHLIATTPISSSGAYVFSDLPVGEYLLAAIADTSIYPYSTKTYYDFNHRWNDADTIRPSCNSADELDLSIIDMTPMNGSAIISGTIKNVTGGKTFAAGDPVPGVDVSLEQKPGGNIVASSQTDLNGHYIFNYVEEGDYSIFVDIPGLGMVETHTIEVTSEDTVFSNKNFFVDSTGASGGIDTILPLSSYVPVIVSANSGMKVYPNPYHGFTNIEYSLGEASTVTLEIYSVLGKRVQLLEADVKQAGKYKHSFSAKERGYPNGVYIIKLRINDKIQTQRIIELN